MPESLTLTNLLDDAAFFSLEHQVQLEEVLGQHDWNVDLQQGRLDFTGSRPLTCTGIHLLGSAAPGPGSWLWGYANQSGFPDAVTELSIRVRDFGQQHGISELADMEVPFNALPGSPDEPNLVAAFLTDAAKGVTGVWTHYSIPVGGGTRAALLIDHPDLRLPPPQPARIMRVLQQGIATLRLTDHRRALLSYAGWRRLGAAWSPDHAKLTLSAPGLEAHVDFDQHGRVNDINATLSPQSG